MKRGSHNRLFVAGLVSFFLIDGLSAQSNRVIELKSADELQVRSIGGEEVRDFVGNVHFVQPSSTGDVIRLWCDRALQFVRLGKIECFGNVRIVRDDVTLTAPEGTYFNTSRRARMVKGVRLERPGSVLTATEGDYETDEKRSHFIGNVVVIDSVSSTYCDDLTYFEEDERSIAVGRVKIVGTKDGVTVFGDSLVNYGKINYTIVPKKPKLLQVDTTETGGLDTLIVVSKVMEAYRDTARVYVASDSVMLVRNEMAAMSGRASYRPEEGLVILIQRPVVWYGSNQVTGDSIAVRLEEHRLRSVFVHGRAMAVSRSDTTLTERFDQLTGRELTLYFGKDDIERIVAERQAISLYYLFDKDLPNGANKSSGDRIIVDFHDGQVDRINVVGGVEGQYMPEAIIVDRERAFNLDGFQWFTKRPQRSNVDIEVKEPR